MLPSATVENYLKAIFQAQVALDSSDSLVPMGQLASALGVVPGTATTMVKTLAESGLVRYEPYAGVRLTAAGEKLAALVLRRHRLIELFLVQVMGMSWTEVHDEAENLEHAVSDRLIDRIDEMLGRPAVDPHGDPIPDPKGTVHRPKYATLLTCPMHAPVTISRVSDQDPAFLTFIERQDLKPGQVVEVEERDEAADSVRLRGRHSREITIGTRAASKVLVRAVRVVIAWLILQGCAAAQTSAPPAAERPEPFAITDNSFFVEEAFNQERGIFQNIFGILRMNGRWNATFTQEWPVESQTHQLSYTLVWADTGPRSGVGDTLINYRYQALEEGPGRPAWSPRASLILPTGRTSDGLGAGSPGLQVNLPFSKQAGDAYLHWNAGATWLFRAEAQPDEGAGVAEGMDHRRGLLSPFVAGSVIYRLRPMLHAMLESVVSSDATYTSRGVSRDTSITLSPGVRMGWNIDRKQIVAGAAVPVVWTSGDAQAGIFGYFSYELPFGR
jgi:DtxR family Mn-dependent transcriptional regulator